MELQISFPVNPIPAIRMTKGQVWLMRIPDAKLASDKLKVKQRIKRYMDYKEFLRVYGSAKKFKIPESMFWVKFFIETEKSERWNKAHKQTPDWDNLAKAFQDALSTSDSNIWDCRITKYWCAPKKGRVEVWV